MTARSVKAFVALLEAEEVIEGHFWAPNSLGYNTRPSDVFCPFCAEPLEIVEAPVFGRICQEQGARTKMEASALIKLMLPTHEALSCAVCGMVMTRLKEGAA